MPAEDNAALLQRGYAAFASGDMAVLAEVLADDLVWHTPGSGPFAGVKHGRNAVLVELAAQAARSGGTMRLTLHDVVGGPTHTIGLHHSHAERDGKVLDHNVVLVCHVRDGRISEVWETWEDTARADAFWS
jgi:ketosteroid isomerase-like protein